jgi:hypothetical protein
VGNDPITDQTADPQPLAGVDAGAPSDNTTLMEVLARYEQAGFTGQFGARDGGAVHCFACGAEHPAAVVELVSLRRLEGASDPDDMLAVAAIRCPHCGARGTAVLGYGPDSAPEDGELLLALEDLRGAEDPTVPADAAPGEIAGRRSEIAKQNDHAPGGGA